MRLTDIQQKTIVNAVRETLGDSVGVRLFGSRLDDEKKGGDIDLYIKMNQPVEHPALTMARIQAKIIMQLGEQKVDVVLSAPNLKNYPIHDIAEQQGIWL